MLNLEVYIPLSLTGFVLMIMTTTTYARPMRYNRVQPAHLEDYVRHIFSLPLPSFFTNVKIPFPSSHTYKVPRLQHFHATRIRQL